MSCFFQTNRSSRLVMNFAISTNTCELKSIPHSTLAFSRLPALVTAATWVSESKTISHLWAWLWPCVRIDYYEDRNNYYKENKLSISRNPLLWQVVNQMVSEVNGFLQKGAKGQSLGTFLFGTGLGRRARKLGLESNQPPTKGKLYLCRERAYVRIHARGQAWEKKRRHGRRGRKTSSIFQEHLELSWTGAPGERSVLLRQPHSREAATGKKCGQEKIFISTGTQSRHDIKGKLFAFGKQVVLV